MAISSDRIALTFVRQNRENEAMLFVYIYFMFVLNMIINECNLLVDHNSNKNNNNNNDKSITFKVRYNLVSKEERQQKKSVNEIQRVKLR